MSGSAAKGEKQEQEELCALTMGSCPFQLASLHASV